MLYDLSNSVEAQKFIIKTKYLLNNKKKAELKSKADTRTSRQNSALHLFFTLISDQLNDLGVEFSYDGLNNNKLFMRHTPHIIKEFIWRPIQIAMFDIESTTKIDTHQINEIVDVLVKYFGDRGVVVEFPNIQSLIDKNK